MFQQDIAKFFRISPQLVFRLVKEAKSEPEKLKQLEKKREGEGWRGGRGSGARAGARAERLPHRLQHILPSVAL